MRLNSEVPGAIAGLVLLLVGGLAILIPAVTGMDMMEAGIPLQFLGFFLSVAGAITAALFGYRAYRLGAMFRGDSLLAHWVYTPAQVDEQAARDLQSARQRNWLLLLTVAGFMVVCTLLMVIVGFLSGEGDNMPGFVGIMGAVFVVVAAFALGMPLIQARRARTSTREALIATNGLYINGALHTWNAPLAMLDAVALVQEESPARLVFSLRSLSRASATAYQSYTVEVPVPPGEEDTARRIAAHFRQGRAET